MKRVAETEDELVVEIPLVVRIRPVVVEFERAVVVAFDVEHVRVAVPVGNVLRAIRIAITAVRVL